MDSDAVYQKNIAALKEYAPHVLEELEFVKQDADRPDVGFRLEFGAGRKGHPTFSVHGADGKAIHGHSLFDPEREAAQRCENLKFPKHGRVALLGMGFGHLARELVRRTEETNLIYIFEPFVSLFEETIRRVDISDILASRRTYLTFTLNEARMCFLFIYGVSPINLPHYQLVYHNYVTVVPGFRDMVAKAINMLKETLHFNLYTQFFGGPSFLKNTVENFRVALRSPGINHIAGLFKDEPIFVVAPGPSLEKNAEQLKRVKGKALIMACDSAVRPLLRHGIEPDCICTVDFQEENMRKLEGVDTSFAYLFPAIEVTPGVPRRHKGRIFSYYHSLSTAKLYDPILGHKGQFGTGGTVLADAFNIALNFGANPLVFVGVDLGFPGMKWYADGSFESGEFTEQLNRGEVAIIQVPDIYGNPMPTYKSFAAFINYFDSVIPFIAPTVIDATEGGARIKGTEIRTLSDVIDEYVGNADPSPRERLDGAYDTFKWPETSKVAKKLDRLIHDFEKIAGMARRGVKQCEQGIERTREKKLDDRLVEILKSIKKTQRGLSKKDQFLTFVSPILEPRMATIFHYDPAENLSREDRIINELWLDGGFFFDVRTACEMLTDLFSRIRGELDEEAAE